MRSVARTASGILLLAAAGFGLAWLFMKKHSAEAAEKPLAEAAETSRPAEELAVPASTPPHKHRTTHPRRGSAVSVEVVEKPASRHH